MKKKFKLRAIDNGTRYDVAGNLKALGRRIAKDKGGDVRDVIVGVKSVGVGGKVHIDAYHYGTGTFSDCLFLWDSVRKEIV